MAEQKEKAQEKEQARIKQKERLDKLKEQVMQMSV